jgi:predicted nucleic acid-binding protein
LVRGAADLAELRARYVPARQLAAELRSLCNTSALQPPRCPGSRETVVSAAEHSGGGVLADVPRTVHECSDHEDNLILDLAAEVGALIMVSNDSDPLSMSPWRGTPIIEPTIFAAKVDAMRRHARRR